MTHTTGTGGRDPVNFIIAGVGGQGNVLASEILATAGLKTGHFVSVGETYGASQRGGAVMSHVRFSRSYQLGPLIPRGEADFIVGLEPVEALRVARIYGGPRTKILTNTRPNYPLGVLMGETRYPETAALTAALKDTSTQLISLDATVLARQAGEAMAGNVVLIGAVAGLGWVGFPPEAFGQTLEEIFSGPRLALNLEAFRLGFEAGKAQAAGRAACGLR